MKDVVLQFKNFLYRERKSEDEKRELLRDLEELPKWGKVIPDWCNGKIKSIQIAIEIRFDDKK